MIAAQFEYLVLLFFFAVLIVTFYGISRLRLFLSTETAAGCVVFFVVCCALELVALSSGWWVFDDGKLLGLSLLGVPIEEMILFVAFYAATVIGWETLES